MSDVEREGELERFAVDAALLAAWRTQLWVPRETEFGFVDYFEAAATRNLELVDGFEELAADATENGILPPSEGGQATLMTDGGRDVQSTSGIEQARLDVGDTTPPATIEARRAPSVGKVVSMVKCAHRYDWGDLYPSNMVDEQQSPEQVAREWAVESAEVVACDIVGVTHSTREDSEMPPANAPEWDKHQWLMSRKPEPDTEQATLVTDGGRDVDDIRAGFLDDFFGQEEGDA
ncbi:hypothetical protein [Halocalculus aciditolerans]|uniref:Uncharacterized protein n=1 Tax=Halocalculus aciditolerans TaxID=1383812 RepID=A0A830F8F5_9EURY|nr:hypothetical protein [Halocalculus aciditolerans]GGL73651.1 hypothetical protein GCM10009039_34690 [Halocalculus aciditolerans]